VCQGEGRLLTLVAILLAPAVANAQTFETLYSFIGGSDGGTPLGVVFDDTGNLYGTTCLFCTGNKAGPTGGSVFQTRTSRRGARALDPDGAAPVHRRRRR
jgi:hypothetical protein